MTYLASLPRKTFGQRFIVAFVLLGLPVIALALIPVVLVIAREAFSAVTSTDLSAVPARANVAAAIFLGAAAIEISSVYIWHVGHYGFSFRGLSRNDRYLMGAPSLLAAPFFLFLLAFHDDETVKTVANLIILLMATAFAIVYLRIARKLGAAPPANLTRR